VNAVTMDQLFPRRWLNYLRDDGSSRPEFPPDESGKDELSARFWQPKLEQGIIHFVRPEKCTVQRFIKPMKAGMIDTVGLQEPGLDAFFEEGGM